MMIGTVVQPPQAADDVDAVDAGQAEVEEDDVGWWSAAPGAARPRRWPAVSTS